jgi:hypothetical protein
LKTFVVFLWALLGCGGAAGERHTRGDTSSSVAPADSLVLRNAAGIEVWLALARTAADASGKMCVERGLEIRNGQSRVRVPLLYTGSPPVLLNDSTIRAILWTHCQPGEAYLVNLRNGQPAPERRGDTP